MRWSFEEGKLDLEGNANIFLELELLRQDHEFGGELELELVRHHDKELELERIGGNANCFLELELVGQGRTRIANSLSLAGTSALAR